MKTIMFSAVKIYSKQAKLSREKMAKATAIEEQNRSEEKKIV